jgi:hypothetical protein
MVIRPGFKFPPHLDLVALVKGAIETNNKLGVLALQAGYPKAPNEAVYGAVLESIVIGMEAKTQGFAPILHYSN